jgi:hypothetical protein
VTNGQRLRTRAAKRGRGNLKRKKNEFNMKSNQEERERRVRRKKMVRSFLAFQTRLEHPIEAPGKLQQGRKSERKTGDILAILVNKPGKGQ